MFRLELEPLAGCLNILESSGAGNPSPGSKQNPVLTGPTWLGQPGEISPMGCLQWSREGQGYGLGTEWSRSALSCPLPKASPHPWSFG